MKYSREIYAKALIEAVEETPQGKKDEVIKRFLEILKKNGDLKRVDKIISLVSKYLTKKSGNRHIEIEIARELPAGLIKEISKNFGKKDQIEISINPQLVAGTRITIDGERELDNSLARKLHKLFK